MTLNQKVFKDIQNAQKNYLYVNFSYKYNLASKLLRPFIQFIDKADDMTRTLENLIKALNLFSATNSLQ